MTTKSENLKRVPLHMKKLTLYYTLCVLMQQKMTTQLMCLHYCAANQKLICLQNFTELGPKYQNVCQTDLSSRVIIYADADLILIITQENGHRMKRISLKNQFKRMEHFGKRQQFSSIQRWRKIVNAHLQISKTNGSNQAQKIMHLGIEVPGHLMKLLICLTLFVKQLKCPF